jgi:hypothetical protein
MKKTISGFITWSQSKYQTTPHIDFYVFDPRKSVSFEDVVVVREHSFEIEVPDNFDPRPQQIEALQAEKKKLHADFSARCMQIERQISELTCLEAS